jgi:hypothetical protein
MARSLATAQEAMNQYSAIMNIYNEDKMHWILLHFDPVEKELLVFDSIAPKRFMDQKKTLTEVRYQA